ncbi:MAG: ABC transporter permease subunit [Methylotenera sp.]
MIINVARKELKSMFASPMGWVILSVLIFAFATYFINAVTQYYGIMSGSIKTNGRIGVTMFIGQSVFGLASFVMLFAVPLLSMRLISEERRSQTLTFLFSAPISLTEIVLGKFLGLVTFLTIIIALITAMLLTLSNWTELDIWMYIAQQHIKLPSLYFAHKREVIIHQGKLVATSDFVERDSNDVIETRLIRYRTVGDMTCTAAVESEASNVYEVLNETMVTRISERGATRLDDQLSEAAMEDRKKNGYF